VAQGPSAARGELHDRALWTPLASATDAAGNSTALVGTPDTVAQALLDYVDIGVTTLLIRGYDPYDDAVDYGRRLRPLVREEVARRERHLAAVKGGHHERAAAAGTCTSRVTAGPAGLPPPAFTGAALLVPWPRRRSQSNPGRVRESR